MNSIRKISVMSGALFIIATVAVLLAGALEPDLTGTDYLTQVSANVNQVAGGALCYLIAAFGSVGVAVALYPVLKERSAGLALGSVVFRTIEAVMYMIAVVSLLSVLSLGQQITSTGGADRALLQAVGNSLLSLRQHANVAGVFAFSLGALLYYSLFFQTRLIPRWLSGWGIVAIVAMLAACVLALFSDSPVTGYVLLALPIAVQEMVMAIWLIARGFNENALDAGSTTRPETSRHSPTAVNA